MKRREFLLALGITALALPVIAAETAPDVSISFGKLLPQFDDLNLDAKKRYVQNIREIEAKTELEKQTVKNLAEFFENRMNGKTGDVLNITFERCSLD